MKKSLKGCHILIVEDEFFLADELSHALRQDGAVVVGTVGTIEDAGAAVMAESINLVILDINLHDEMVFEVATGLAHREVPFVFVTGYDDGIIPLEFRSVPRWVKPLNTTNFIAELASYLGGRSGPQIVSAC